MERKVITPTEEDLLKQDLAYNEYKNKSANSAPIFTPAHPMDRVYFEAQKLTTSKGI